MSGDIVRPGPQIFSLEEKTLIDELAGALAGFALPGRYAVALGGSRATHRADQFSDFDFRLYSDVVTNDIWRQSPHWPAFEAVKERWKARGWRSSFWLRTIGDIDAQLDQCSAGNLEPAPLVWTIWGYHLMTDIASQRAILDPEGVVANWHRRLETYPPALKTAILQEHGRLLSYWKADYHYQSKVARGDAIFLASLSAKIVHSLVQVVFALNETYYPGDGLNGECLAEMELAPPQFRERITAALYPGQAPGELETQRQTLLLLISEVETLYPR